MAVELTQTARMYDAMASDWTATGEPLTSEFIAPILDRTEVGPDTRLIDVATGTGALAIAAAERGAEVLAIDIAPAMIEEASERLQPFPRATASVMDAQTLPLEDATFDVATSLFGITCADDFRAALAEMARVVQPDGMVAVSHWADPAGPGPTRLMIEALSHLDQPETGATPRSASHSEESLRRDMAGSGLVDIEVEVFRGTCEWPPADRIMTEMDSVFRYIPAYAFLTDERKQRLTPIVKEIFAAYETSPGGKLRIEDQAFIAFGRRAK